jgi:hypothetical protein
MDAVKAKTIVSNCFYDMNIFLLNNLFMFRLRGLGLFTLSNLNHTPIYQTPPQTL